MERSVIISLEEYNRLLQDRENMRRLEKGFEEGGFLVKSVTNVIHNGDGFHDYEFVPYKAEVEIVSKDEVLMKAESEIRRLSELCVKQAEEISAKWKEIEFLRGRGLFQRVFNVGIDR